MIQMDLSLLPDVTCQWHTAYVERNTLTSQATAEQPVWFRPQTPVLMVPNYYFVVTLVAVLGPSWQVRSSVPLMGRVRFSLFCDWSGASTDNTGCVSEW